MSKLADLSRNRWPEIFSALGFGFSEKLLKHKNVPCPMCLGRDRFQFTDKGWGRWHCRGCGGGDGVRLVECMLGLEFCDAAKRIEEAIGIRPRGQDTPIINVSTAPRAETVGDGDTDTDKPLRPWREAGRIRSTAGEGYQAARGHILTDAETASLRFHGGLWHWPSRTRLPAVVALVARADGTELCAHMTFLAFVNGRFDKAPVKPKLFPKDAHPVGGGTWFGKADPGREFVVAEGPESALSAMRLCGAVSGVAAMSAIGLERLVLPPEAKLVRIFADHDADRKGELAAIAARRRWRDEGRQVRISLPKQPGEDPNDVWLRRMARG
jgi:putative DNA primase/helicase